MHCLRLPSLRRFRVPLPLSYPLLPASFPRAFSLCILLFPLFSLSFPLLCVALRFSLLYAPLRLPAVLLLRMCFSSNFSSPARGPPRLPPLRLVSPALIYPSSDRPARPFLREKPCFFVFFRVFSRKNAVLKAFEGLWRVFLPAFRRKNTGLKALEGHSGVWGCSPFFAGKRGCSGRETTHGWIESCVV